MKASRFFFNTAVSLLQFLQARILYLELVWVSNLAFEILVYREKITEQDLDTLKILFHMY